MRKRIVRKIANEDLNKDLKPYSSKSTSSHASCIEVKFRGGSVTIKLVSEGLEV